MREEQFDKLARTLGGDVSRRFILKASAVAVATGVLELFERYSGTPSRAYAAEVCTAVDASGFCPTSTEKKDNGTSHTDFNGCGGAGSSAPVPQGFGFARYTDPCNYHDICYGDCHTNKDACDRQFLSDILQECKRSYPFPLLLARAACIEVAAAFYLAVHNFGDPFWASGQQLHCKCCKCDGPTCGDTCCGPCEKCENGVCKQCHEGCETCVEGTCELIPGALICDGVCSVARPELQRYCCGTAPCPIDAVCCQLPSLPYTYCCYGGTVCDPKGPRGCGWPST